MTAIDHLRAALDAGMPERCIVNVHLHGSANAEASLRLSKGVGHLRVTSEGGRCIAIRHDMDPATVWLYLSPSEYLDWRRDEYPEEVTA